MFINGLSDVVILLHRCQFGCIIRLTFVFSRGYVVDSASEQLRSVDDRSVWVWSGAFGEYFPFPDVIYVNGGDL